jgi:hypothetical protein
MSGRGGHSIRIEFSGDRRNKPSKDQRRFTTVRPNELPSIPICAIAQERTAAETTAAMYSKPVILIIQRDIGDEMIRGVEVYIG